MDDAFRPLIHSVCACTLKNRRNNLTEFTEKALHNLMASENDSFLPAISSMLSFLERYEKDNPITEEFLALNQQIVNSSKTDENGVVYIPEEMEKKIAWVKLLKMMDDKHLRVILPKRDEMEHKLKIVAQQTPNWTTIFEELLFPNLLEKAEQRMDVHFFSSFIHNCTLNSAYPFAASPVTEHQVLGDYLVYVLPIKLFELFIDNTGLLSYAKLRRIRALENDWGIFSQVFSNEAEFFEKAKNVKITFPDGNLLININS